MKTQRESVAGIMSLNDMEEDPWDFIRLCSQHLFGAGNLSSLEGWITGYLHVKVAWVLLRSRVLD